MKIRAITCFDLPQILVAAVPPPQKKKKKKKMGQLRIFEQQEKFGQSQFLKMFSGFFREK